MSRLRLSPDRWIDAGLDALVAQGPAALRAEPLARSLGTTKGSFYWHFADVPSFHATLLGQWERDVAAQFERPAPSDRSPVQDLRRLVQSGSTQSDARAVAMRSWAKENPAASAAVGRVDDQFSATLSHHLNTLKLSNPELARLLVAARIGMADMSARDGRDNKAALGTLVDLVLALYG